MSFIVNNNGNIEVTKEGMQLPPVKHLWNKDKTKDRMFFHNAITFIYWAYTADSIFSNMLETARYQKVALLYCNEDDHTKFTENPRVKAVIDLYVELSYSALEHSSMKLRKDLEAIHRKLDDIPFEREAKIDVEVMIPIAKDKPEELVPHTIRTTMMIDNSEEKIKVINMVDKLYTLEDRISTRLKKERKEKKKTEGRALFDK